MKLDKDPLPVNMNMVELERKKVDKYYFLLFFTLFALVLGFLLIFTLLDLLAITTIP
jgi:hypothetical protein